MNGSFSQVAPITGDEHSCQGNVLELAQVAEVLINGQISLTRPTEGFSQPALPNPHARLQRRYWTHVGKRGPVIKGYDADKITYEDKLAEFPYMALLFNGWGFGVEYNEPRGHSYMVRDQLDIDPSRIKTGGVCLTCESPYAPKLEKEMALNYYKTPYKEVLAQIPENHRNLGVACIDCHDNKDMSLKISRGFTLTAALKDMGVDHEKLTRQEMRSVICAQCHVTYNIPKDKDMKSVGVFFPWQGSKWGAITVENVIKKIRSDASYGEWAEAGVIAFSASVPCKRSGTQGLTFRVLPRHDDLGHPHAMGLVLWAS